MSKLSPDSFALAYCRETGCSVDRFEALIMRKCFSLPIPLSFLCVILVKLYPTYFEIESLAIGRLALVQNRVQFQAEIEDLHYLQQRDPGLLWHTFPVGLSLQKLMKLSTLLPE